MTEQLNQSTQESSEELSFAELFEMEENNKVVAVGDVAMGQGALIALDGTGDEDDKGLAVAGATSNSDCVLAPSYETAVFTAGRVRIILEFIPPTGSSGDSLAV